MTCLTDSLHAIVRRFLYAGESEESHRELVQFCKDFRFERMGAFAYSEEEGTPAAALQEQVDPHLLLQHLASIVPFPRSPSHVTSLRMRQCA